MAFYDRRSNDTRTVGICLLLIAALFLGISRGDPPKKSDLVEVSGTLRSVEKVYGRYGLSSIRFGLTSDSRTFQYYSKEGALGIVEEALDHARGSEVKVLFDARSTHTPWFGNRPLFTAYELKVGTHTVRSYEAMLSFWRSDNTVGLWIGYPAAVAGVFFLFMHFRKRRCA